MTHACDNCGAPIERRLGGSRVFACPYCETTQVWMDDAFRTAGEAGAMLDAPSLFALGEERALGTLRVRPLGHVRLSYGSGWWDEYWCETDDRKSRGPVWVSVDEGDVAIERPLPERERPAGFEPALGASVTVGGGGGFALGPAFPRALSGSKRFTVVEAEVATCLAVRGELPERILPGERHRYFDLIGKGGGIVTIERWEGGEAWFRGQWVDPWAVTLADLAGAAAR